MLSPKSPSNRKRKMTPKGCECITDAYFFDIQWYVILCTGATATAIFPSTHTASAYNTNIFLFIGITSLTILQARLFVIWVFSVGRTWK